MIAPGGVTELTREQYDQINAAADIDRFTREKWSYVECWIKSFAPSHSDKLAVLAWCLSQMMKHPPPYTVG